MNKSMAPGGGGRFAALESKLAAKPGITNPGALAATIGRKKFGPSKMAKFAARGRRRAARPSPVAPAPKLDNDGDYDNGQ